MTLILHGANGSPFVRKIQVILAEKSIPYEQKTVVPFGPNEDYKKMSPLGKIPCLQDGDYVLPDSSCIAAYLERAHPTPPLYPADSKEYGRALWYEEYGDTKLVEVCTPPFFERVIRKGFMKQQPDEERIRRAIEQDQPPVFAYLEGELGDRQYLVGGRFSIADIAIASPFINLGHAGVSVDASRFPRLVDFIQRITSRPSFKACIEAEKAFLGAAL